MEYGLVDRSTSLEMLHHDALEEFRSHAGIPCALGIHHDDRTSSADAEARCLATFYPSRSEEESFALEKARQLRVQLAAASIR